MIGEKWLWQVVLCSQYINHAAWHVHTQIYTHIHTTTQTINCKMKCYYRERHFNKWWRSNGEDQGQCRMKKMAVIKHVPHTRASKCVRKRLKERQGVSCKSAAVFSSSLSQRRPVCTPDVRRSGFSPWRACDRSKHSLCSHSSYSLESKCAEAHVPAGGSNGLDTYGRWLMALPMVRCSSPGLLLSAIIKHCSSQCLSLLSV